jgi:hypothetical protein
MLIENFEISLYEQNKRTRNSVTTLGGGGVVLRAEKHTVSGRVTSVEDIADLQAVFRIRIRIRIHRIHMFLGLLDPDPLFRSTGVDPDPSIIKQI